MKKIKNKIDIVRRALETNRIYVRDLLFNYKKIYTGSGIKLYYKDNEYILYVEYGDHRYGFYKVKDYETTWSLYKKDLKTKDV